jgi:transcriptional regulator with XRE-family HTH domain
MKSSISGLVLQFHNRERTHNIDKSINMRGCISIHRYATLFSLAKKKRKPDIPKPWMVAIKRHLGAELRPDPRPKPGHAAQMKFWNQQDLAFAAKIGGTTLSQILNGKRIIDTHTLFAIAGALSVSPAVLLMDEEESAAYRIFQRERTFASHASALESTVNRLLEERGEAMKKAWVAGEKAAVMKELPALSPEPSTDAPAAIGKPEPHAKTSAKRRHVR